MFEQEMVVVKTIKSIIGQYEDGAITFAEMIDALASRTIEATELESYKESR